MLFDLFLVLLKSIIIFFVLLAFEIRWLFQHHVTKQSTSSLLSLLSVTETPHNCRGIWVFLQMTGRRWQRNGESTVPCGAPGLQTTWSDTQPFSPANWCVSLCSPVVGGLKIKQYWGNNYNSKKKKKKERDWLWRPILTSVYHMRKDSKCELMLETIYHITIGYEAVLPLLARLFTSKTILIW